MTNPAVPIPDGSLVRTAIQLGFTLPPDAEGQIATFGRMLYETNTHTNLTRIPESDYMTLHVLDCLAIGLCREFHQAHSVIDVGTGAGLPGILLAIAMPQTEFLLIDARSKKIDFVKAVISALGIANARALHIRAEDHPRSTAVQFDMAVSRATGPLERVLTATAGLVKRSGMVAVWKGPGLTAELAGAGTGPRGDLQRVIELTLPGTDICRRIALFRSRTPEPRRAKGKVG
ncbi:MAG: 16S rRNA (guanine(527)-N(7))-methyltransferase RsmG [Armatimonadetes bacterium]|nr:16S rRNA (guanine(527)-N(7))-methyltransferase RsmG [Armatimonadota bacterium]MDE2206023.1 16S rRNA (guanine(527)-N(7))-methyltransferase RsmG [Armatimonadota bacterium]